jgi:hypothetical protein
MPNQNTIARLVGGNSPIQGVNAIPSVVPTGTSAFIVLNQAATAAVLAVGDVGAQPTGAQTYGSGFDGIPFKLRVAWKVTTKAACNVTVAIVLNATSSTTYASGNVIATTGAKDNGTGSYNGWLEAIVLWDSTYGKVTASYWGESGGATPAVVAYTTGTNAVALTAQSGLLFSLAATFSDTTAGTTMTVTEFVADQL